MAITDLTGYTWTANNTVVPSTLSYTYFRLSFTCDGTTYDRFLPKQSTARRVITMQDGTTLGSTSVSSKYSVRYLAYGIGSKTMINVYGADGASTEAITVLDCHCTTAYKTIAITGGTQATDSDVIAWFEANGTLTKPTDNTIKFGSNDIDKIYFGGTEVHKIYMGSDVVYSK